MGAMIATAKEPCPVCHSPEFVREVESFGEFQGMECEQCTLQFADPLRYDEAAYRRAYSEDEGTEAAYVPSVQWAREMSAEGEEAEWLISAAQRRALAVLEGELAAGSPVLDIGCGTGWFLECGRRRGWTMHGLDVGEQNVAVLREKGFRCATANVDAYPADWPEPRAVTLFEVLEHLPDPVSFLNELRGRFPGAPLVISVPSPKRWTRLGGERDLADLPPNHLTRWTRESLERALRQVGYRDVRTEYPAPDGREFAQVGLRGILKTRWAGRSLTQADALLPEAGALPPLGVAMARWRWKSRVGGPFVLGFRAVGWSAISILGVARG
jgi:hypothetical protein